MSTALSFEKVAPYRLRCPSNRVGFVLIKKLAVKRGHSMYTRLKDLIAADSPLDRFESNREIQIAAITLMVEASLSNGAYGDFELGRAVDFSRSEFCLTDAETGELLEIIKILRLNPEKTDDLLALLKQNLNTDQLIQLLSVVWKILLADGKIDGQESEYAASVRRKLGLTMEQAILAQQMANEQDVKSTH
jgi:uncharacterized tellurite resistance protein B-like protein